MDETNEQMNDYERFRNEGNNHFKSKNYKAALNSYTKAIAAKGDEAIGYSNRAICYINLKRFFEAELDCDKAIALDPKLVKAYYRRAIVRKELYRYELAMKDFEMVFYLDPNFIQVQKDIESIKTILARDERITLKATNKPDNLRTNMELKKYELRGQFDGAKTFDQI